MLYSPINNFSRVWTRNLDSPTEGLSIKLLKKSFKESDIFFMKNVVGSALKLSATVFVSSDNTLVNVYVDLVVFTRVAGTS